MSLLNISNKTISPALLTREPFALLCSEYRYPTGGKGNHPTKIAKIFVINVFFYTRINISYILDLFKTYFYKKVLFIDMVGWTQTVHRNTVFCYFIRIPSINL